ncbi:hypothetical protein [Alicyclobacillus acidocaldarius]|uniref:Copper amine oxidase domain protein n=1 Tax=Alicyclobacillus acidocaldarius (strain Tc-4-1) TaxID=1048834 RepID=F8ICN1_ALIAT|nr:hypothetical protein [Alicyclobacillus acidocaldarius]AEJ43696.1 hypothetical protein TC41_1773 [Alicyclobacillus acidocaldarius subsp. acidocaldarius Tc-4-1]
MKRWTKATLGALSALAVCAAPASTFADSGGAVQVTFIGPEYDRITMTAKMAEDTATLVPMQITLNGKVLANTYAVTKIAAPDSDSGVPYIVQNYTPGEIMVPLNVVSAALNGQAGIQSYLTHEGQLVNLLDDPATTWTFNTLLYRNPLPVVEDGMNGYTINGQGVDFTADIAVNLNLLDEINMFPIKDPNTGVTDQFVNVQRLIALFKAMGFGATYDTTTNTLALTGPTPRPTYTKVTPQIYKQAVAQAQQAQAHHTTGMFGMLANNAQWYPDPKNVFFNRRFDVQKLHGGQVLQKWPWVVFLKGAGMGGSDVVAELVARGNNGTGFYGFYMIYELVDQNSGNVEWIAPNYWLAGNSDMQGAKPPLSRVPDIGTAPIYAKAGAWAYGYGLDIVPNLNWHTGINPVNP